MSRWYPGETNLIGKQIGKYEIQDLLGKGGMGKIYKASHPTLERAVAIKLIHLDQADDPTVVERFRREAKVVAALRHPGIIQVYDFDIEADLLYMVMEFVPGVNLGQHLASLNAQKGQLSLENVLRLFHRITQAVAYATDASTFNVLTIPTPIFGPGHPSKAHTRDEYIEIDQLEKGLTAYKNFLENWRGD